MSAPDELAAAQRRLEERRMRLGIVPPPATDRQRESEGESTEDVAPIAAVEIGEDDPYGPPVPEGEYCVAYVERPREQERGRVYDGGRIFLLFRIVAGAHAGRVILRFYNEQRGPYLARSSALWRDFLTLTGRRPPSAGFRPSALFRDCQILARVATLSEQVIAGKREKLPEAAHYSKIEGFVRIEAGRPPALTGSMQGQRRKKRTRTRP